MRVFEFTVHGTPAPKGSGRAIHNQHVPSSSTKNAVDLATWSSAVQNAARLELSRVGCLGIVLFVGVPIKMTAVFRMKRPRGHLIQKGPDIGRVSPKAPKYCIVKPDGSKILRSTEDDLTGLVYDDDSKIAEWHIRKLYADPGKEGAWIRLEEMQP